MFFLVTIIYVLVRNNAGLSAYEEAGGAFLGRSAGPAIMKTVNAMIGASFAFAGTELVGITAGEAANPRVSIPRAVNGTFYRIIFFYISCIFLIGLLLPANLPAFTEKDDLVRSPFVVALASAGISGVDHIMNFVCFIAVYSAANSTVYASARCLMALAQEGQAPRFLARTHNGVPFAAMLISVLFGCIAFCGSLIGDGLIFDWLVNMTGLGLIVTWMMINITHILFRRAYLAQGYLLKDLPYQAVFYPYGCYFAIFVTGSVIVLSPVFTIMTSLEDPEMTSLGIFTNFMGTFISIPLFVGLFLFWKYYKKTKFVTPKSADLFTSNINLSKIDGIYYGEGTGEEELKGWKKLIAFLA